MLGDDIHFTCLGAEILFNGPIAGFLKKFYRGPLPCPAKFGTCLRHGRTCLAKLRSLSGAVILRP